MSALAAPDKFKGTFSAREVAEAIALGIAGADVCPVADGGEGTLEALPHGELRTVTVEDPFGRPIAASFGIEPDGTAVVEAAAAVGLALLGTAEFDPRRASSRGAGDLIAAAIAAGARRVLVGCGGTATMDGGLGIVGRFDPEAAEIVALCDTRVPFELAPQVFGPQKGATPELVERLEDRQREAAHSLPRDPSGVAMTGAGGGLSGALWALGARLVPGAPFVLDAIDFDRRARRAGRVITGEGRLDATTLSGKAVDEIASRCRRLGVPCHAIVGSAALEQAEIERLGLQSIREATDLPAISRAATTIAGDD